MQRFGDNIRVHVRLIHAATDQVIWDQNMSETCTTCCLFKTRWHEQLRKQFRSSSAQSKSCALKLRDASILRPTTILRAGRTEPPNKAGITRLQSRLGRAVSIDEFAAAWAERPGVCMEAVFIRTQRQKPRVRAFRAVDKR